MARQSMFWAGNTGSGGVGDAGPYSDSVFADFVKAIFGEQTGVLSGLRVVESTPNAKSVVVQPGKVVIHGRLMTTDADETLTIADNTSGNPRIDRIVAECDWAAQTITLKVVPGTPGASPTPPALTQNAGTLWQEPLAQVSVADGFTAISDAEITGERTWAREHWPGEIKPSVLSAAPAGWLLCDGSAVSRDTYADLFDAIGTTFGAGDGSTTFNLPDMRGRAFAGLDNMGGSSANVVTDTSADTLGGVMGEETHTLTEAEMPAHGHKLPQESSGTSGAYYVVNNAAISLDNSTGIEDWQITTLSAGGDAAHNNMQPTLFGNWIIKT